MVICSPAQHGFIRKKIRFYLSVLQHSEYNTWEVVPMRLLLYQVYRDNTQTHFYAAQLDMDPPDLSALASRIVIPEMTAELLSLSWLLSVDPHAHAPKRTTHTCQYISTTTAVQHQHQLPLAPWICLSVCLLTSQLDRTRRSDGLVTWQWQCTDAAERLQSCPLFPTLHIPFS